MKISDVKVGMVVWDSTGRAYVKVLKIADKEGLVRVGFGDHDHLWCMVPHNNLSALTKREKGE